MKLLLALAVIAVYGVGVALAQDGTACSPAFVGASSFVCTCSDQYCDFVGPVDYPPSGSYKRIVSSRDQYRFEIFEGVEEASANGNVTILVDHTREYQSMLGFGGAFTDSTGINVLSLNTELQDKLIKSYFGPSGIEYTVARIPIAGSDFSTYPYSYDEVPGDVDLEFFSLTDDDYIHKIPLIQKAIELSEKPLYFFGSPWSPPSWMKENGMLNGTGGLLPEYWDPFAQYLIKFIEAYESNNITIWGLTPQNEPLTGFEDWAWNTCAWTNTDMRDFIKNNLGPAFGAAGLRRVKIMLLDHNRDALPWFPAASFEDPEANQYVDGTAVHWYGDADFGTEYLDDTNSQFPDKFLLYTEACEGWYSEPGQRVILGDWDRGQNYANNIIEDLNHFVTGWVDWNMALDLGGGPNWAGNYVDSPILVDPGTQVFHKQPMYYALGHFSKFIPEGSKRMYSNVQGDGDVVAAAFHTLDDEDVLVVLNKAEYPIDLSILNHEGNYVNFRMNAKSIETVLFK